MRYVVHEHRAKRAGLHYDLRFESSRLTKSIESYSSRHPLPRVAGIKRMLIKQPNHDKRWLSFEGEIESGYGAGTLKIWDKGTIQEISSSRNSRILKFNGNRLSGEYVLVKLDSNRYLFFKRRSTTRES